MDLLTHEQEYRSEALMRKIAQQHIIVCGCGAIGSNLIDNLVRQGFRAIDVIDMDRIEKHNLGSQIWERREAGNFKVRRMKERAYAITGTAIGAIEKRLDADNIKKFIKDDCIAIDAFDNTESRHLLYDHCQDKNCLHIGLFQDYAEVIWNENYTVPQEGNGPDVCEYPLARNITMLSVIVASEVLIKFIETGEKKNYMITLRDMKISELDV
jgi:molybdopterin/thiamine biosynthesis adenylyltransferase